MKTILMILSLSAGCASVGASSPTLPSIATVLPLPQSAAERTADMIGSDAMIACLTLDPSEDRPASCD